MIAPGFEYVSHGATQGSYSTSSGMLTSVSRDGVLLWEHSLTEEYGRLTFPNGRIGAPVKGPLFEFAPAIDEYLKTHLFGDIFARDNLDWQSRELATLGVLAALQGVESQLQAHMRISMNVGLTADPLRHLADVLAQRGWPAAAQRAREALDQQPADAAKR